VTVGLPEDPDWPPDAGDVLVWSSNIASHTFDDLVEETANFLVTRPGIREVTWEDRELIVLWGEIDCPRLQAELRDWWRLRLAAIATLH
jgi:hypothetical protein